MSERTNQKKLGLAAALLLVGAGVGYVSICTWYLGLILDFAGWELHKGGWPVHAMCGVALFLLGFGLFRIAFRTRRWSQPFPNLLTRDIPVIETDDIAGALAELRKNPKKFLWSQFVDHKSSQDAMSLFIGAGILGIGLWSGQTVLRLFSLFDGADAGPTLNKALFALVVSAPGLFVFFRGFLQTLKDEYLLVDIDSRKLYRVDVSKAQASPVMVADFSQIQRLAYRVNRDPTNDDSDHEIALYRLGDDKDSCLEFLWADETESALFPEIAGLLAGVFGVPLETEEILEDA